MASENTRNNSRQAKPSDNLFSENVLLEHAKLSVTVPKPAMVSHTKRSTIIGGKFKTGEQTVPQLPHHTD